MPKLLFLTGLVGIVAPKMPARGPLIALWQLPVQVRHSSTPLLSHHIGNWGPGHSVRPFFFVCLCAYSPSCPGTCYIDQATLKLRDSPVSSSGMKGVSCHSPLSLLKYRTFIGAQSVCHMNVSLQDLNFGLRSPKSLKLLKTAQSCVTSATY